VDENLRPVVNIYSISFISLFFSYSSQRSLLITYITIHYITIH